MIRTYIVLLLLPTLLARKPGDAYWTTFLSVENALQEIRRTMPEVSDQRGDVLPPSLVWRGCNQAATIILSLSKTDQNSYAKDKALEMVHRMAEDARHFSPMSMFRSFHPCLGVCTR